MNTITMELLCGRNTVTGEMQPAGHGDVDEVKCNGRRIALVSHAENAGIRFLLPENRITQQTLKDVLREVTRLRADMGRPPLAENNSFLPDPEKLKAAAAELSGDEEVEDDDE